MSSYLPTMFQSFTGNSRRPRQVDLSGRNSNPFAAYNSPRQSQAAPRSQITVANAQHERLLRQQERDRLNAAKAIQRNWRGHKSRRRTKDEWRQEWDYREGLVGNDLGIAKTLHENQQDRNSGPTGYTSESEGLKQLQLLLLFVSPWCTEDVSRLERFAERLLHTFRQTIPNHRWAKLLLRLTRVALGVLLRNDVQQLEERTIASDLSLLVFLARAIPKHLAQIAGLYYQALASLTVQTLVSNPSGTARRNLIISCVLGLLQSLNPYTLAAYEGFATFYLATPDLPKYLGDLENLAAGLNFKLLASSLSNSLKHDSDGLRTIMINEEKCLWLLAYFIYFHRHTYGLATSMNTLPEPDYVTVVSSLLCSVAGEVSARLDLEPYQSSNDMDTSHMQKSSLKPLPQVVQREILSLVDQKSITGLLTYTDGVAPSSSTNKPLSITEDAGLLASYALTLLRVFPRRGDDIRMWLYLGSALIIPGPSGSTAKKLPALKYFWKAARNTSVYGSISRDPSAARGLLKSLPQNSTQAEVSENDQEWQVILLFLELYTFVLKVMDDEEFLSGGASPFPGESDPNMSWTRESALPLRDVADLTTFLKNLAFTMYWNASELSGTEDTDLDASIGSYFATSSASRTEGQNKSITVRAVDRKLAGVTGMSLDYLKGMVTGLLRMVYERE